jgi:SAM-dependent methyltransferase
MSVQDAPLEVEFIERVYKRWRGRNARSLREDFCGTALLCAEWVKAHQRNTAAGIDIDPSVLAWGKRHNLDPLGRGASRVQLLNQDVRDPCSLRTDAVCAFNFSYWVFKTRPAMREYFQSVHRSLKRGGMFFLDAYGGWEAQEPMLENRTIRRRFTYVWDQDRFDPITHDVVNYIHFKFQDGSKMMRAFEYKWRFWSLAELCELLEEAGFSDAVVYWDVSASDSDEDYRPRKRAENQPGWLAYIVATR